MTSTQIRAAGIGLMAMLGTGCDELLSGLSFLDYQQRLAERWAPVHHQDVDTSGSDGLGGRADYLSAVDLDGDWDPTNNWQSAETSPLRGTGYYSVVGTPTHWFITYGFYHPRDWTDIPVVGGLDTHENDMEGLLAVVRREGRRAPGGEGMGTLEAIVTVFHLDFFSYTPAGSPYLDGEQDIDGTLQFTTFNGEDHPTTAQEAKGHGLKAHPDVQIEGGDGVIYWPTGVAEEPSNPNDREVGYALVSFFHPDGLWDRRNDSTTYARFGVLRGDDGVDDSAKLPWAWDDGNDGSGLTGGEMALDPARLIDVYFNGLGDFETDYTHNPYADVRCTWPVDC